MISLSECTQRTGYHPNFLLDLGESKEATVDYEGNQLCIAWAIEHGRHNYHLRVYHHICLELQLTRKLARGSDQQLRELLIFWQSHTDGKNSHMESVWCHYSSLPGCQRTLRKAILREHIFGVANQEHSFSSTSMVLWNRHYLTMALLRKPYMLIALLIWHWLTRALLNLYYLTVAIVIDQLKNSAPFLIEGLF